MSTRILSTGEVDGEGARLALSAAANRLNVLIPLGHPNSKQERKTCVGAKFGRGKSRRVGVNLEQPILICLEMKVSLSQVAL